MADIAWEKVTEVKDPGAALEAAQNCTENTLLLRTPEGSLFTLGSRFWLAVGTKLIREYPNIDITIIVDAGDDAGIALGAIMDGHLAVRFTGDEEAYAKLKDIADSHGITLIP